MMRNWTDQELLAISRQTEATLIRMDLLLQAKRRERGAWNRPGLADSAGRLEKQLLASYWKLARDIVDSLRGASDDVASGRLAQQRDHPITDAEEEEAREFFGISEGEAEKPVDRSRLAAILVLIGLWFNRHTRIAEEAGSEMFDAGRKRAIEEAKLTSIAEGPQSRQLRQAILARYQNDIERLRSGLQEGTKRSAGIEWAVENAGTVGEAAVWLRRLFDSESFRLGMLAESLVWTSFLDGHRAGAVEAVRELLRQNGAFLIDDFGVEDIPADLMALLPRYVWAGPMDAGTCSRCMENFGDPVIALSVEDLPSPQGICLYGLACRHWWALE